MGLTTATVGLLAVEAVATAVPGPGLVGGAKAEAEDVGAGAIGVLAAATVAADATEAVAGRALDVGVLGALPGGVMAALEAWGIGRSKAGVALVAGA